jgi:hypothetical protein
MFTLFVSHNCGLTYFPECEAETLDELRPRMAELDESMLRWYLKKDEDFFDEACAIHKGILAFMAQVNESIELRE